MLNTGIPCIYYLDSHTERTADYHHPKGKNNVNQSIRLAKKSGNSLLSTVTKDFFSPRPSTSFFTNLWTELATLASEALLRENQGKQQQNVISTEG